MPVSRCERWKIAFVTVGLPYRVIGGPRFYERKEIKDAIAYFEVIFNSANDLKFERIVNNPKRGLGEVSLRPIYDYARAKGIPLAQSARELADTEELRPGRTALHFKTDGAI